MRELLGLALIIAAVVSFSNCQGHLDQAAQSAGEAQKASETLEQRVHESEPKVREAMHQAEEMEAQVKKLEGEHP